MDSVTESKVRRVAEARLPTGYGEFNIIVYISQKGKEHVALTVGQTEPGDAQPGSGPVLVRLHSECLTSDVFGSARCDCGEQLHESLRRLQEEGRGILLYMRQEGRGIGLANKIRAYALQQQGYDTVDANLALGFPEDMRDYSEAADILKDLGITRVRLLTNNPAKIEGLERGGIEVAERLPLHVLPNPSNAEYLRTKQERMDHLLPASYDGLVSGDWA